MDFCVRANVLSSLLKSNVEIATKGVVKHYLDADRITLVAEKTGLMAQSFGGLLGIQMIFNSLDFDDLDYSYEMDSIFTVRAIDFTSALESFEPGSMVSISLINDNGKRVEIVKKDDDSEKQSIPVFDDAITLPIKAEKFDKEVTVNKDMFIAAVNKVFFAVGFSKFQKEFLYWIMRYDKEGSVQFAAGTGARFAVYRVEGSNMNISDSDSILFPKEQTPVILSVLGGCAGDNVTIKQYNGDEKVPAQIVFEFDGGGGMILTGFNTDVEWIDEDFFLNKEKKFKITTKTSDWKYPMKGIRATYNEDVKQLKQIHDATIEIDSKDKNINLKTSNKLASQRKVPFANMTGPDNEEFSIRCISQYLAEMVKNFDENAYNQIEFIADNAPIVVHDFASEEVSDETPFNQDDIKGFKERFSMFFSVLVPDDEN